MIDTLIVTCMQAASVDMVLSLPCAMLSGIIDEIDRRSIPRIPVCREEEGVGIAAGAALAGKRPLLLMQNSGLGNCINALASLTGFYRLPLFLLMSHRGGPDEQIAAQIPMGQVVPKLLDSLDISHIRVETPSDIDALLSFMRTTYENSTVGAALLSRELWHAAK
jgi:sulfopyruvate decarboxylase subunit alpha